MGSQSDWATMRHAADTLASLDVPHETRIVSAHRTPDRLAEYAKTAAERGLAVIIAGAGGAAHLPGMCASWTALPVLGVPVESHSLKGMDSLLSIAQMPAGIPVGTLAIGRAGAVNAALARRPSILALSDPALATRLGRAPRHADRKPSPNTRPTRRSCQPCEPEDSAEPGAAAQFATIGIVGGGQLGRMSAMAAARLGYRCHILTPEEDSPAVPGLRPHLSLATTKTLPCCAHFAESVDVITFEFENVSAEGLDLLASIRPVRPSPAVLRISQDRKTVEKGFLNDAGVATAPFVGRHPPAAPTCMPRWHAWGCRACSKPPAAAMTARARRRCATCPTLNRVWEELGPKAADPGGVRRLRARDQRDRGAWAWIALRSSFDPVENRHQ